MHLIEIIDGSHEQQLLVDPGVVTHDAECQGAAEGAPLVPQCGVLGDPHAPGEKLMPPVIGHGPVHELAERDARLISCIQQRVGAVLGASLSETLHRRGHDRCRDRRESRCSCTRHGSRESSHPGERRRGELDGETAVSLAVGVGYLEVACFDGVFTIGNGRPTLSSGRPVHGTTLPPCNGAPWQYATGPRWELGGELLYSM
jgi:hypothetical protein